MRIQFQPRLFVCSLVGLFMGACGTLVGNPEEDDDGPAKPEPAAVVAPVSFSLTDAPLDDAQSVLLTVESLEVSLEGEGWIKIPLKAATEIDLLKYQDGETLAFAEMPELPVGTYNQTRLKLSETATPKIVLTDGSVHELEIPSSERTGVKIVTPFTLEAGVPLALTIDFDLRKSVKLVGDNEGKGKLKTDDAAGGRYVMKPVLRLLRDDEAGSVSGSVPDGKIVCVYPKDAEKDDLDDCDKSANSAKVKDGKYHVGFLPPGDYEIRVFDESGGASDVKDVKVEHGKKTDLDKGDD